MKPNRLSHRPSCFAALALSLGLAAGGLAGCVAEAGYAIAAPPPARVEVVGVSPGPGYFWLRGHWGWRYGRYAWEGGRWARAPREGAVWTEPRWEYRENRYRFIDGYWR